MTTNTALAPRAATAPARASEEERLAHLTRVYEGLASDAPEKKRNNLKRLRTALESMRERGQTDYGPTAVSAAIRDLGFDGPKRPSLKNEDGEHFRVLMRAYAEAYGRKAQQEAGGDDDDIPLQISDPKIASRVKLIIFRAKGLEAANAILNTQFRELTTTAATRPHLPAAPTASPCDLTPDQRGAVRRFLAKLPQLGWKEDPSGAILDALGNEIAPPRFLDALHRMTGGDAA